MEDNRKSGYKKTVSRKGLPPFKDVGAGRVKPKHCTCMWVRLGQGRKIKTAWLAQAQT